MQVPAPKELHPPGLTAKGHQRIYVDHQYVDRSQTIHEPSTSKEREALDYYHKDQIAGQFPVKLQTLLRVVEKLGLNHIFGWQPHGRSFTIRDPAEFESIMTTRFFNQRQISSFRRQLNLYNFKRITRGPDAGSYYHEMFLRGKPLFAYKMTRRKVKGTKFRATSSPESEPDFYTMPYLEGGCDASRPSAAPLMSLLETGIGININDSLYRQGYRNNHNDVTPAAIATASASTSATNAVTPSSSATSYLYSKGNVRDLLAYHEEINNQRVEALMQQTSLAISSSYGLSPLSSFLSGLPMPRQKNARQAGSSTFDCHNGVGEFYESSNAMRGLLERHQASNSTFASSFLRDVEANDRRLSIMNNVFDSRNQMQNLYDGSDRGNNTMIGAIPEHCQV